MARQPIVIGSANAKQGDTLFDGATKINANETELYADTATNTQAIADNAQAIIDTTALITGFTKTYWFFDADTATQSAPISHTGAANNTYLTNNSIGAATTSYNPDSKASLWNASTNRFDFSSLKIGDTVEFRGSLDITNAAAQEIDLLMSLAEGSASPYELNIAHIYYKTASSSATITFLFRVYIGEEGTRTNPARFRFASPAASSIKVLGFFSQITSV